MKKYINTKFEIKDQKVEERMLVVKIEESDNEVILYFATLSYYFEKELLIMAQKEWPDKRIKTAYCTNIHLDYFSFRTFKEIVFK